MGTVTNHIRTVMLMALLTGGLMIIGGLIGGRTGVVIALVMAAVMNLFGYFFSAKLALASMSAQEVGPDHMLYKITAELAQRGNMPMPKVYVSPQMAPNAFATGRNPKNAAVCATEGLLHALNRNEIAGVMAHELAHVRHRDILIQCIAATMGGAITYLGYMAMFNGGGGSEEEEGGGNPLLGLFIMILGPIAAGLIQMAISRQREFAADTEGARLCGDPMYLASALEKIHRGAARIPMDVNPSYNAMMIAEPRNLMENVGKLFATHPPLEARLMNLIGRESIGGYAQRVA